MTVTDQNGCQLIENFTLVDPPAVVADISATQELCPGETTGMAMAMASGGTPPYTYLWNTGAMTQMITGLSAGTYTVTVTDANGCMTTCDVVIEENMALTCVIAVTVNVSCNGESDGSLEVTPTGGDGNYQFSLNGGPFQPGASFAGLSAGVNTVTVMDDNGCTSTCMATITQPMPLPHP